MRIITTLVLALTLTSCKDFTPEQGAKLGVQLVGFACKILPGLVPGPGGDAVKAVCSAVGQDGKLGAGPGQAGVEVLIEPSKVEQFCRENKCERSP